MGKSNAKAYGKRNTTEGVILVRVKPTKIIAEKDKRHGNNNNDDCHNIEIDQHNAFGYISYHLINQDVMKKIIDIAFPNLDDKNVRIELDDTLSRKTFKAILTICQLKLASTSGERSLY